MGSANLDLVRSIYADWERGDFSVAKWAHPDMEYVHTDGPDPGRWTGLAEVTKGLRDFLSAWSGWWTSAEQFRELDDGRVAVLNRYSGRGKTSGVEVGQTRASGAAVFRVQGGKVTSIVIYFNRDRALGDLGLAGAMPEERTTPDLVELAQRWIDAVNAGDVDAAMNLFASDVVWEGRMETFEGRAALRHFVQDWLHAYDELEFAAEEIGDLGNGVIFSVIIQRGRPRGSTGWVQYRYGVVARWLDGLVRRSTLYLDIDEARAAAERLAEELG